MWASGRKAARCGAARARRRGGRTARVCQRSRSCPRSACKAQLFCECLDGFVGIGVGGHALAGALEACMTVVWSRPPKASPMAGSVRSVSSRARYMATWRGQATRAARLGEQELVDARRRSASQVACWISRTCGAALGARRRVQAVEDLGGERDGDRAAGERVVGDDADERALERADVVGDAVGDAASSASASASSTPSWCDALAQDRQARARGRVGGCRSTRPALEALAQAVLEGLDVARAGGRR